MQSRLIFLADFQRPQLLGNMASIGCNKYDEGDHPMTSNSIQRILSFFCLLAALGALTLLAGCNDSFHPYQVSEDSMSPTFHRGDRIFADQTDRGRTDLHDGDVIVFRHNGSILLKRILAMPGEIIIGADRKVFRNGKQLAEPYLAPATDEQTLAPITFGPRTLGSGELFVMGDNRDDSLDSRSVEYGPVLISDVIGKYSWTYWHASAAAKEK